MRVLLTAINAKYIHSNLAVYSLRAYACHGRKAARQEDIVIGEYTINQSIDYILKGIYKARPDILCFSCYIWNIAYVEELAREFHKLCPDVPIWVGGPEVSYETEQFLQNHPEITGAMIGEGEKTFLDLYCCYREEEAVEEGLAAVRGIAYRRAGRIIFTEPQEALAMDEIPFCYAQTEDFRNRIIYYESSRGCPFCCSYCLSSVEKTLRFRSTDLVKKELAFFLEQEVPQVKFVDRTFNCKHEHAMEIWRFIKEHDNGVTNFHFEISADLLRPEELELLGTMRPGLVQLEIGVQSTNEATITEIHRTMQLERLKETVRRIQENGNIHEHLDLIAGLPYEDYQTFARSFDEIYALKPNQLQLGFLKVLKGSYMYGHAAEYGMIYHTAPPYEVMQTNWLSFFEVLLIKQVEEMLETYYNSGQFEVTMKMMETLFESAFSMYQKLGAFYEKCGYFAMSHSRVRRCEILLEFVQEYLKAGETDDVAQKKILAVLQESLIFDLYYRENCKSRPSWAADVSEWKERTKQYCKNGKTAHVERFYYRFPQKAQRTLNRLPERLEEPVYVRFDYTKRDPLDHQAEIALVE